MPSKKGNRNGKIAEVKEVIQNRSNNEIEKVLDFYNNDVGKTINAFVEGTYKEAFNKQNENNDTNSSLTTSDTTDNDNNKQSKQKNKNNSRNKNITNKFNLNDIVNSVINKYTSANTSDFTDLSSVKTNDVNQIEETSSVLNVNKINDTVNIKNTDTTTQQEKQQSPLPPPQRNQTNSVVNNVNAKKVLEKSQKDLQRQTVSLAKITTSFEEEIEKSSVLLCDTFKKIRELLNNRELQLQHELDHIKTNGNQLLARRQSKATELKYSIDGCERLTDSEVQNLKSEIKHFVSERKLDEELGMTKRFDFDMNKLKEAIETFGCLVKIENNYSLSDTTKQSTDVNSNSDECVSPMSTTPSKNDAVSSTSSNNSFDKNLEIVDELTNNLKLNGAKKDITVLVNSKVNGKPIQNGHVNGDNHVNNNKVNNNQDSKKPQRVKNDQLPKQQRAIFNNNKDSITPQLNGESTIVNGHQNNDSNTRVTRSNSNMTKNNNQKNINGNINNTGKVNGIAKQNGINGENHKQQKVNGTS